MLTATTLTRMRNVQNKFLPDTATLKTRSYIGDGQGGKIGNQPIAATGVPCRLAEMSKEQRARWADKLGVRSGWVITLAYDQSVGVGDHIEISGETYTVLGTNSSESWQTALRMYCARVK